jgi:hypothetical protein
MLEKYLAKSLQQQQQQGDASEDVGGELKNIQSLIAFCLTEYAIQTSAHCDVRGRLLHKLADGYERLFLHAMDLIGEERQNSEEANHATVHQKEDELQSLRNQLNQSQEKAAAMETHNTEVISQLRSDLANRTELQKVSQEKLSSAEMECDLYRQECEKAWEQNVKLQKELEKVAENSVAIESDPSVQNANGAASASPALLAAKHEIDRLNAARIALEQKLEQVTAAILNGGIEGLGSSLETSTYVPSGFRGEAMQDEAQLLKQRPGLPAFDGDVAWRPVRTASPDAMANPTRLRTPPGRNPEPSMRESLDNTYYATLRNKQLRSSSSS